ncbi:MAG: 50S ribosomal protein L16 [Deferribacterota bacterium]|nr:50S ribosomal protein L16 [Deferribacterota bacterium]
MLMPKKTKYRKAFKGRIRGRVATKNNSLVFGDFALISDEKGRITSRQIESGRIAINRSVKKGGKLTIRIFPHHPVTKKPAETRMGKGKGAVEYYVARVKKGTVLYEIADVDEKGAREAFRLAAHKMPVKCKFLSKNV